MYGSYLGLVFCVKVFLCSFCSGTSHAASSPKRWVDAVGCQKPICSCKAWFFLRLWFQTGLQALLLKWLFVDCDIKKLIVFAWLLARGSFLWRELRVGCRAGDAVLLPHVHVPAPHTCFCCATFSSQILHYGWWNRLRQERNGGPMNETRFQQQSSNICLAKILYFIAPKFHWFFCQNLSSSLGCLFVFPNEQDVTRQFHQMKALKSFPMYQGCYEGDYKSMEGESRTVGAQPL